MNVSVNQSGTTTATTTTSTPATTPATTPGSTPSGGGGGSSDGEFGYCTSPCAGTGVFAAASYYTAGADVLGVAVGDVDNDDHPDVVTANYTDNDVSVLINDGAGAFTNAGPGTGGRKDYAVTTKPVSIDLADLNGDGYLDIVTSSADDNITILLNDGDGTFDNSREDHALAVNSIWPGIKLADVNNDTYVDIIVTENINSKIVIYLNEGDGTFNDGAGKLSYLVDEWPYGVDAADLNGDGWIDIVGSATTGVGHTFPVLINDGDGTFDGGISNVPHLGAFDPWFVRLADVGGDSKPDIITLHYVNAGYIGVHINDGDGTFHSSNLTYTVGMKPVEAASGDINGDGKIDLAVANETDADVSVLMNNGSGAFTNAGDNTGQRKDYAVTGGASYLQLRDVNDDNALDLIVNTATGIGILLNTL